MILPSQSVRYTGNDPSKYHPPRARPVIVSGDEIVSCARGLSSTIMSSLVAAGAGPTIPVLAPLLSAGAGSRLSDGCVVVLVSTIGVCDAGPLIRIKKIIPN